MKRIQSRLLCPALCLAFSVAPLSASAIVDGPLANTLSAFGTASAGEGNSATANIGFSLNFFGSNYTTLSINESGNVTFNDPGGDSDSALPTLAQAGNPMIAAFLGDVDTTGSGSVTYGDLSVSGQNAFAVDWSNVGYFSDGTNRLNSFQLLLIQGTNASNYTIEFNYGQIQWEAGQADGGTQSGGGLGGQSAIVGYTSTGTASGTQYELPGSSIDGAFVTGGPDSLVTNSLNSGGVGGRYEFNGSVAPEPGTSALFAAGLVAVFLFARKLRQV